MRLAGKRVLLTGTPGGQGEAAQAMFAREGARIVGCDVREGSAERTAQALCGAHRAGAVRSAPRRRCAERTAQALCANGHDVTGHTVDLTDPAAAAEWVNEAVDSLGGVDGIRANATSPGFVTSPATDQFVGDELRAFQMEMHLIRRPGTGDDIAHLAVFLASDESTWVTGQNHSVDGGVTAGFG